MSGLLVTPLSALPDALTEYAPSHLVSLLSPEHMIETPAGFAGLHLKLGINDIVDPAAGPAPPARQHIDALLEFSRAWDQSSPFLIHCWAGISRSMATAFTILCDRLEPGREEEIAQAMRRRAPHAQPNRLLVQHADEALGRDGAMVAAVAAMGLPQVVEEGVATFFPLVDL